ncbi:MAG: GGDEF domain-containing phosphodiesterase [Lachnospiraceae bacterium]|nr:GGDEF domain-containing phosphodiesterase [Lachnospiraceae bacterium]
MDYIIHYDVASFIITLAITLHFFYKKSIDTYQTKLFSLLIGLELVSSAMDLVTMYTIGHPQVLTRTCHYFLNGVYLLTFNATSAVYFAYIVNAVKKKRRIKKFEKALMLAPFGIDVLATVTTPLTGLIFVITETNEYVHGSLFFILYFNAMLYVLASQVYTVIYRAIFTKGQQAVVYAYTISSFVVLIVQMIFPNLMISQFAVAIAVLLIYLSLENPQDYTEKGLGTFNRQAFEKILTANIENEKHFSVFTVALDGMQYISETMGTESANSILKQFAESITGASGRRRVFYVAGNRFAVVSESRKEDWGELVKSIQVRCKQPFYSDAVAITLTAPMCVIDYPEDAVRLADIEALMDICLDDARMQSDGEVVYANIDLLEKHRRESRIIQIMKQALQEHQFAVYYQPIFSVEKKRFTSAEALIRLQNDELGFISPEEFIPLAEKNGLILEIGEFVFREVCRFIVEERLLSRGIEYIEVNLSVVQCMQESLYQDLLGVMDEYHLPYPCINLEITETAAVMSHETLMRNMSKLIERGVNFSLDDYGTGFSNTTFVIKYPFRIVKIDKSMVWSAMEDEKAMYALKYTMAMVKAMGMELVAEGVENEEHIRLLTELGCDFFQGYYYSKPVSGELFLEKIGA